MDVLYILLFVCLYGASDAENRCIQSCENLSDGDYQSCHSCRVFVTCSNGIMYDDRPCPSTLVWDDNLKQCMGKSSTCPEVDEALQCPRRCIRSCKNRRDGDYQSCHGCRVYATCSNGILYDDRPCPAKLVWDDNLKICNWNSTTCPEKSECPEVNEDLQCPKRCIKSCKDKKDGDYQSCHSCRVFVTCSNGIMYDDRPCPSTLVWDDNLKQCMGKSSTCPEVDEALQCPRRCIRSCKNRRNGDYQSCHGCRVYATCSNGILYDDRPCPAKLVWDDNLKICNWNSTTCPEKSESPELEKRRCIRSCKNRRNGDYQSCHSCRVYATCSNGILYDDRPCPAKLVWDDNLKICNWNSTTCPEKSDWTLIQPSTSNLESRCIKSCQDKKDGDYQSCHSCRVFVTCSNGIMYDDMPCPATLVWDDNLKQCVGRSKTCPDGKVLQEIGDWQKYIRL